MNGVRPLGSALRCSLPHLSCTRHSVHSASLHRIGKCSRPLPWTNRVSVLSSSLHAPELNSYFYNYFIPKKVSVNPIVVNGHGFLQFNGGPPLDHDFHSGWGSNYSMRGFIADHRARELWKRYSEDPGSVERQYHAILSEYTENFHDFFRGYWPISLHAHVSDVLVPTTMATLILNTASTSPFVIESPELSPMLKEDPEPEKIQKFVRSLLGWTDIHVTAPRFAVVDGIYGGAFGPLVGPPVLKLIEF